LADVGPQKMEAPQGAIKLLVEVDSRTALSARCGYAESVHPPPIGIVT
jgi:hypothetical protein